MRAGAVIEKIAPTCAGVALAGERFQGALAAVLEPGGCTRANVAEVAAWFDGPVWDLLDASDAVLAACAVGDIA